jgi:uncharacterized membrane protein YraQ (UPF0718 family)
MDIFYPIKVFADWLTYQVFSISPKTLLAEAVDFFIYDTIKIFILLAVIIFTVSVIRSFLPQEKIRKMLSHKHTYVGNILAAVFGIITPFCTCSAIPLFLGFIEAGVPLGATFSFLVSSPMINEVALVLLLGMFGLKVALIYIFSGLIIAIISGIIIGQMKVENLVEHIAFNPSTNSLIANLRLSWEDRVKLARDYTLCIIKGVWLYVVIGIGVGAWMHGFIPSGFLAKYAGGTKWYAVPVATLIGIPLYSNAAGVIPLVSVLTEKGISMGTALAFMMAVTGLSLPEFMILRKVMKIKLLTIFAGVVGAGIVFTGYLFNFILK